MNKTLIAIVLCIAVVGMIWGHIDVPEIARSITAHIDVPEIA